jgi:DNA polymerase I-like protein with 3'-5' exonuclease and polymerase domains
MSDSIVPEFLFHYSPPVELQDEPVLLLASSDGTVNLVSLETLSQFTQPIVTHSFSLLVGWFRRRMLPLPSLIWDMELACKLGVGLPKDECGKNKPWDMWNVFQKAPPNSQEEEQIRAALTTHMSKPTIGNFGNLRWMLSFAKSMPDIWGRILSDLRAKGEEDRYFSVEVPVFNIMMKSQFSGIRIDPSVRDEFLHSIDKNFISASQTLMIKHGVDIERALVDVAYLERFLSEAQASEEKHMSARDIIAKRKSTDEVCSNLHEVMSEKRNKNILYRTFGHDTDRCYPIYDIMGTVTGRILMIDPHLQYLRKRYRKVICASDGHKLVYLDYSQFEPTIMAHLSEDKLLNEMCAGSDFYTQLSLEFFGVADHRKVIKKVFLAYSYGMGDVGLANLLMGLFDSHEDALGVVKDKLLVKFGEVERWKETIFSSLKEDGRMGTSFGNYRYRIAEGELLDHEKRWGVSQAVQGTGSLILKKVIVEVNERFPSVNILLPLHDALLVEVPEDDADSIVENLTAVFRDCFVEVCPSLTPRVALESFSGEPV